jgi:hypothetical protein
MSNPAAPVQRLWNSCNLLRDHGLSYGDYVEQLTSPKGGEERAGLRQNL